MTPNKKILWPMYLLYVMVSGYTMAHHELWADETHSWNIAKASGSYTQLIENRKYEGHPPAWYTVLWSISKFTHNTAYMQAAQWVIACLVAALVIFYSPFPAPVKALFCFGYYFLFEYAVFSRNYAIGVFFTCCICLIAGKEFRYKTIVYYLLLFCLSNVHLLGLLLAASLHFYFLMSDFEQKKSIRRILILALAGAVVLLPAAYFIFPPSDSTINTHYWLSKWNYHHLTSVIEGPLRGFLPLPAWWNYHFWNTQFLIEAKNEHSILKPFNLLVSLALIALACFILRKSRKSLALFGVNLLMSLVLSASFFSLTSARYAGFIFIGFFAALWLYCYERPLTGVERKWTNALLGVHMAAGVFAVTQDIRLPFSNMYRISGLMQEVPADGRIVTDYWTMNGYVAYLDKPVFCVDLGKEMSFVIWNPDMARMDHDITRYTTGIHNFMQKEQKKEVYMVSMASLEMLSKADTALVSSFHISQVDKLEGAIEKGSNLYLYKITL